MNRRDRSARSLSLSPARSLCQAAGLLWREIISELLQEADACQQMLSVKVRALLRSLFPPPCLRRTAAFFIFSPLSAFLVPIIHCFSGLLKGFSVIFRLGSFILADCLKSLSGTEDKLNLSGKRASGRRCTCAVALQSSDPCRLNARLLST